MPIKWKKLDSILPIDFTISSVLQLALKNNDIWAGVLTKKQNISEIISRVEEI
jgi:DNA primase